MGPLEFTALFGGLVYWPVFMIFHRRWSLKAKWLFGIFLGTIAAVGVLGSLFLIFDIHLIWPLQFVFPIITLLSLFASFVTTVVFDNDGNV
jgi:hypothetical protein